MIGAKTVDILLPEHKKYNLIESDIYYHYKFMNPNLCVEISADRALCLISGLQS